MAALTTQTVTKPQFYGLVQTPLCWRRNQGHQKPCWSYLVYSIRSELSEHSGLKNHTQYSLLCAVDAWTLVDTNCYDQA